MNENAQKWVDALLSGEYKQGRQYLRRGDYYCCLGVACEVYIEQGGDLTVEPATNMPAEGVLAYDHSASVLPNPVRVWLGLRTSAGDVNSENSLASLNDAGSTFAEIAEVIKSEPENLFVEVLR